jgi:hypothetical protein
VNHFSAVFAQPGQTFRTGRWLFVDADWISDTENMLCKQYKAGRHTRAVYMAMNHADNIEVRVFLPTLAELMSHLH